MILEKTYHPFSPLNQFVDVIWLGKSTELNVESSHHAALFTELIFNYGDNFQVDGQNIENIINKHDHQIISGLKTEPFQTKISGTYGSIGLLLKPFCYGILIEKFGSRAMEQISEILYEHIFVPKEADFKLAEQHLLQLFSGKHIDPDFIKFENYISSNLLGKGALKDFNLSLSITQKSFIQKFKKHYLLTPNDYLKLTRVNTAIQLLQNNKSEKLIGVALDSGFYDQSHFIKIFKKFCGCTPKKFYKL
ncbi:helix-turn-helix domain-containing protein [Marinifilum sp. N1E240]|uniref:helix-turn-helix domain-containing protein n=1 Tax=Marinifilum sp. N1E240 TaxID=2608082 RepID=UPI00128D2286|nr:helix-turn-helix domain-containing protein [Marinifilum sp. N1E240]MPQ48353.1 helix-turn-helix domain-containing protein [Marinifilum sp. N1E240]